MKCVECRCCDATAASEATAEPLCHECAEALPCRRGVRDKTQVSQSLRREHANLVEARVHAFEDDPPTLLPRSLARILKAVSETTGVPVHVILGKHRNKEISLARQIAIWLTYQLTGMSTPQIGRLFSGMHHTTVLYSVKQVNALLKTGKEPGREVIALEASLRGVTADVTHQPKPPSVMDANQWWRSLSSEHRLNLYRQDLRSDR